MILSAGFRAGGGNEELGTREEVTTMNSMTRYGINDRPSADELRRLPVLSVGQADNLHYDSGTGLRFWVSRMTKADGVPTDNAVTIEVYDQASGWSSAVVYDGVTGEEVAS